jgi:outer membrane protein assembly factor BamD
VVNFNEDTGFLDFIAKQDMADRDQKAAKESFDAFKELVSRFPDSKYSEDARQRMGYMVNTLARSELNVARYYHRRGAYVAAINRLQTAIQDFQGTPATKDALALLADCYDKLNLTQLRDDTLRVLQTNYPAQAEVKPVPKSWWRFW